MSERGHADAPRQRAVARLRTDGARRAALSCRAAAAERERSLVIAGGRGWRRRRGLKDSSARGRRPSRAGAEGPASRSNPTWGFTVAVSLRPACGSVGLPACPLARGLRARPSRTRARSGRRLAASPHAIGARLLECGSDRVWSAAADGADAHGAKDVDRGFASGRVLALDKSLSGTSIRRLTRSRRSGATRASGWRRSRRVAFAASAIPALEPRRVPFTIDRRGQIASKARRGRGRLSNISSLKHPVRRGRAFEDTTLEDGHGKS